ncbi:MAG: 3-isopropylmalate dehydratase [Candidatus Omnitrophica bacterium]|nr:3-isopropylmalate dehydratase [Candidatus Omnitrophota bacterium]
MSSYAKRLVIKDNINTEYIIPARYKMSACDEKDLSGHIFEDVDPGFRERMEKGDYLIAGSNFGCGSSREEAPLALKASGLKGVIARSFSRIFYRNAFNIGLCLIECETNYIDDMDDIEVDMEENILRNNTKGVDIDINPTPPMMRKFLKNGGVVSYFIENGSLDGLV